MRGAVSVALVYLYYDPDGTSDDKSKSSLISATLTVVLFSTLAYGAITKPMLDFLLGIEGMWCMASFLYLTLVNMWEHGMYGRIKQSKPACTLLSTMTLYVGLHDILAMAHYRAL